MANEYSRLFFLYFNHRERGQLSKAREISERQQYILKDLKENGYDIGALLEELKTKKLFENSYDTIIIFTDGGVRNNHDVSETSIAASAFAIYGDQKMLKHDAQFIGDTIKLPNNNIVEINSTLAEYHGLLKALLFAEKFNIKSKRIVFLTDCASMVQHINTKLPVHTNFKDFAIELRTRLKSFRNVELRHIPREHNKVTDKLVNQLLNTYERGEVLCS